MCDEVADESHIDSQGRPAGDPHGDQCDDPRAMALTSQEAHGRLARDGPNELPDRAAESPVRQLARQLTHFFALMLWAAGGLAFVAGMPELGIAIFIVVVINGAFAFAQEFRAEKAAESLRRLLPQRVTVLRDGRPQSIDARDLVVDDVVQLASGDRVSADMRALSVSGLLIDVSTLTGESVPIMMAAGEQLSAGTFVVEGEGVAVVNATGAGTRLATISVLTEAGQRPRSPLVRELDRVVRVVAFVAVGVGSAFFGLAVLTGSGATQGFLFAIGVTVALVPEGLLPTVTMSLAVGAQRMARRHALVRRLESVETLGSTTFVCTDKTGTLTRNEMEIVEVWTPSGTAHITGGGYGPTAAVLVDPAAMAATRTVALAAARCSTGRVELSEGQWRPHGDPMEAAIAALGFRLEVDVSADEARRQLVRRLPFDARRRRMSSIVSGEVITKGAPDAVLPRCVDQSDLCKNALAVADDMASRGFRVLAVAARPIGGEGEPSLGADTDADVVEHDLRLLGLLGIEDPPRAHAAEAIAQCRSAGVRLAMVTGDHPRTAMAIAAEVGLTVGDPLVFIGSELPDDEQVLGALLDRDGVIVARVTPEDKLRIARALQGRGHVVAMTGDGVNDGPALRQADIGVAMGLSGTDVARNAADLVLLDDDFATIVAAIHQGRASFVNVRWFLTYHLTDNVAELTPFVVWALSAGRFPLALGVLQILCLDIGTDLLPALALGAEPPNERALTQPSRRRHLIDSDVLWRVFGVLGPSEALVEMAAFVAVFVAAGWRPGQPFPDGPTLLGASGAAFAAVVIGQAANAFACRSATQWVGAQTVRTNTFLVWAVLVEVAMLAGFLAIPPLADRLGHGPPPLIGFAVAVLAAPAVVAADTLHKTLRRRRLIANE
jgi:calcium-translocating P-type ATPase